MRRVRRNLPLVNPYWPFPVTFLHMPRQVYQKDLTHNCPWDWSEADQPVGPWIILWAYFEDKCNMICLWQVIRDVPAPPWLFKDGQDWHHCDTATSAPLGAGHQVLWTHTAQIPASNPSLCFHLLLTAVSSLNPASKNRSPGDRTAEDFGIKSTEYLKQVCINHHSFSHPIQQSLCLAFYCWCRGRSYVIIIGDDVISTVLRKSSCFHNSKTEMQTNIAEFVLSVFQVVKETTGLFAGCKTNLLESCMTPFLKHLAKKPPSHCQPGWVNLTKGSRLYKEQT